MSPIIPGQSGSARQSPEVITTPTGVIYRFTQPTKPTQRSPEVPLGIGDRWEKSNDGTSWFWNGSLWLGTAKYAVGGQAGASFSNSFIDSRGFILSDTTSPTIFVERARITWEYTDHTASNYWRFQVLMDLGNRIHPFVYPVTPEYTATSGHGNYELDVNTAITFDALNLPYGIRVWAIKVGSPGNATVYEGFTYRLVSP